MDFRPIKPIEKDFNVPIHFLVSTNRKFKSVQKTVTIQASFLEKDYENGDGYKELGIRVFADLTKISTGNKEFVKLQVESPTNIKIKKVIPDLITVIKE